MKLKKYIEFIKESVETEIDDIYSDLDEEMIEDYFIYLKDANWEIDTQLGYIDENGNWSIYLLPNVEYKPGYEITIAHHDRATSEDVTDYFITGFNIIKDTLKDDNIKLIHDDYEYDISDLVFKKGITIESENSMLNSIVIFTSNSNKNLK